MRMLKQIRARLVYQAIGFVPVHGVPYSASSQPRI